MSESDPSHGKGISARWIAGGVVALVLLGVLVPHVPVYLEYRREQAVVAAIERRGGLVLRQGRPPDALAFLGERYASLYRRVASVRLGGPTVTDSDLACLSGLTELHSLALNDSQVTDAGLARLTGLRRVRGLALCGTQVTDAGLAHLRRLTGLEKLYLSKAHVTDAGLRHLSGLTQLRWLHLNGTQVTDAGVDALKAKLPDCEVYH